MSEIDSFYFKFKHLLISGLSANLNIKSEAGKAFVNLTAEVEVLFDVPRSARARNSPSRLRRTARRTAARRESAATAGQGVQDVETTESAANVKEAEVASVSDKGIEEEIAVTAKQNEKNAEEAKVVLHEPEDEIDNSVISNKDPLTETVNLISVIPMTLFNMSDEALQKGLKDKLEAKCIVVKHIDIHRSNRGAFIRSDVLINPVERELVKNTDFLFANCQVLPCYNTR